MKNWETDDYIYVAGVVVALCGILALVLWRSCFPKLAFSPCLFYTKWELYCPGCGGTRSVLALLAGDWGSAFRYHPAVPLVLVGGGGYLASQTLWRLRGKRGFVLRYTDKWLWAIALVLAANCLLRNMLLHGFQIAL